MDNNVNGNEIDINVGGSAKTESSDRVGHSEHHHGGHHHGHHHSEHRSKKHSHRSGHHTKHNKKKNNIHISTKLFCVLVMLIPLLLTMIFQAVNVQIFSAEKQKIADLERIIEQLSEFIGDPDSGIKPPVSIREWDSPIYDANIPVFELSEEKPSMADAPQTSAALYAMYDDLMARHPEYITKTDLGLSSDGVTHVYRYDFREPKPHVDVSGKLDWSETKAKAIIVSGIHWEWGGIFALYNALEEIAENPLLYDFRRSVHLIVLPMCNPYAVDHQSVRNANGVEIHRNFEVDFVYPGQSGYIEPGERSHGGVMPLSEVETVYIDNVLKNNKDAAFFLSCHSFQVDDAWGTGFIWASPSTKYMCNMGYRVIDKLSASWMNRYGEVLSDGIAEYKTENLEDGDHRFGFGSMSTTNGTEAKQATKYGIQGINLEICDTFWAHGTKAAPESPLSSFSMSRGTEVYVNFLLTAFGVYDPDDKQLYNP